MVLSSDTYGWPEASCQYPGWLTQHTWQALGTETMYFPDQRGGSLSLSERRHHHTAPHVTHAYKCLAAHQAITYNNHTQLTALVFTQIGW